MRKIGAMIALTAFIVSCGVSFAGGPPGLTKKGKIPPGFSKGKKVGWQNEYPPGWDKKSEMEQGQWHEFVRKGRDGILKVAEENGLSAEEALFAADDFEKAARKGLVFEEAERLVNDMITKGKKGNELSALAAEQTEMLVNEKSQEGKKNKDSDKKKK
jgi:hypothetical protein